VLPWLVVRTLAFNARNSVQYEQGDHLPQGARGHVVATIKRGNKAVIRIRFPTGYEEDFDEAYLRSKECFLWATGQRIGSKPTELSSTGKASV
jgi:hypothetical protein